MFYRLMKQVKQDLVLPIDGECYWSDNTTVLYQIHSRNGKFEVYQSNRLCEILEENGPDAAVWRYVPTDENPSDDDCRGIDGSTLTAKHRFYTGPPYLSQSVDTWPTFPGNVLLELDASSPSVQSSSLTARFKFSHFAGRSDRFIVSSLQEYS